MKRVLLTLKGAQTFGMERLKHKLTGRKGQIHAQIYSINYIYNIVNVWVILN